MEILGSLDLKTILKSHRLKYFPSRFEYRLHETKISTLKIGHPKQEVSYSNHQFSGREFLVHNSCRVRLKFRTPNWSQFEASVILLVYYVVQKNFWSIGILFLVYYVVYKYETNWFFSFLLIIQSYPFFQPLPTPSSVRCQPGVYFLTWNKMRHLPHASCSGEVPKNGTVWISWDLGWGISLEASCHTWRIGSQDL